MNLNIMGQYSLVNMGNKTIALIPARSGSKRVKNKNINKLKEHPLIAYTIQSASNSNLFDEIIVSTDSEDIKEIAEYYGANVPFMRPKEYAEDTSPDIEWVKHSLDYLKDNGSDYKIFSILRPTSPFRKPETILRAFDLFNSVKCDSLRAVEKCLQHPCKMWKIEDDYMVPFVNLEEKGPLGQPLHSSQYPSLPEVYVQNASLEIAYTETVNKYNNISGDTVIPFITMNDEGFDLNIEEDWELANILISNGTATLPVINKRPY